MPNVFRAAFFAVLAVVAASGFAYAGVSSDVQTAISNQMAQQCAAAQSGDFDAFARVFADDFKSVDVAGNSQTKDQTVENLKANAKTMKLTACAITIKAAAGDATTVTVDALSTMKASAANGSGNPIDVTTRESQTWVKAGDAWLEKSSTERGHVVKIGDKIVDSAGSVSP